MTVDERARELALRLAELLEYAVDDGGPTPLRDALERWHERFPWQDRRPVERELAQLVERALRAGVALELPGFELGAALESANSSD